MAKKFNAAKASINSGNKYIYPKGDIRAKTEWISTGSYPLNAVLSGSIFKGVPSNRAIMLAGMEASGKSFFTLRICKSAANENYFIYCFDSESDKDEETMAAFGFKGRGIDYEIHKIKTVEQLRLEAYSILNDYMEYYKDLPLEDFKDRTKILFLIDSIGFLGTDNTKKSLEKGKVVKQMQLQQQLKELFKDLLIDCNYCHVPLVMVNHVYDELDMYSTSTASTEQGKKVGGGAAGRYGASAIVYLSTKQKKEETKVFSEKDGKEVTKKITTGTFFTAKAMKGRYVRAGASADIYIDYEKGINKNFGLQRFCEEGGLVEKFRNGNKGNYYRLLYKKNADGSHEEVKSYLPYIPEMLPFIDEIVQKEFKFGESSYDENGELVMNIADDNDEDIETPETSTDEGV